jgi:hypothetical protein
VGYTETVVEKRVAQQYPTKRPDGSQMGKGVTLSKEELLSLKDLLSESV